MFPASTPFSWRTQVAGTGTPRCSASRRISSLFDAVRKASPRGKGRRQDPSSLPAFSVARPVVISVTGRRTSILFSFTVRRRSFRKSSGRFKGSGYIHPSLQYLETDASDGWVFSPTTILCPFLPSGRVIARAARLSPSVTSTFMMAGDRLNHPQDRRKEHRDFPCHVFMQIDPLQLHGIVSGRREAAAGAEGDIVTALLEAFLCHRVIIAVRVPDGIHFLPDLLLDDPLRFNNLFPDSVAGQVRQDLVAHPV